MVRDVASLKELLADRYRIDRELGRGGFATVYEVWNPRLERAEALKVLAPGHEGDEDFSLRFTQEVRLAAALEHPSIVKVYDFGETRGIYWYSMQLVVGQTLREVLREKGVLSERETARIAVPLLAALEYSHGRGIVHRDIKPENIILDGERRPYLMDFGIAKTTDSSLKTRTGLFLGTPAYVAPEQAQGKPLDGRADVYALGVTLFKVVAGTYPFVADDSLQAVVLRLTQPPRPLRRARPGVNPAFAAIVMKALEREPSRRWESAGAMREALAGFLEGRLAETVSTRAIGMEEIHELAESAEVPSFVPSPEGASPTVRAAHRPSGRKGPRSSEPVHEGQPRRGTLLRWAAGVAGLLVLSGVGLVVLKSRGPVAQPEATLPATVPAPVEPSPLPTALPAAPSSAIEVSPRPEPTATAAATAIRILLPTRPPEAPPPLRRRPVNSPAPLDPDPPFSGPPPAGCSGVVLRITFAVDAAGNLVSLRSRSTGVRSECTRYVLEAAARWKWQPAVDSEGVPVLSRPMGIEIELP